MMTLKSAVVGFKEWLVVCDALGAGRQSLILRKGGIAEGRGGFQWQRDLFLLFPTHFHQQREQVTWEPTPEALADLARPDDIILRLAAQVEWSGRIDDWAAAAALAPHHVWTEPVVRERFGYGGETGLSVAVVRVFRLAEPIVLTMEKRFGGCRSWVDLPEGGTLSMDPVLDETAHAARLQELAGLLPFDARPSA
jgi:hypothetical protein